MSRDLPHVTPSLVGGTTSPPSNPNPAPVLPPDTIYELPVLRGVARRNKTVPIARVRRSPPLGPSPLRSMILPDTPGEEDTIEGDDVARIGCSHIGLGLPSLSQSRNRARLHKHAVEAGDNSDGVLGIIRELVYETNDWDPSLFVDDNFKTLIIQSKSLVWQHKQGRPSHDPEEYPCQAFVSGDASLQIELNDFDEGPIRPKTWFASGHC
jgi:hypothetical protein